MSQEAWSSGGLATRRRRHQRPALHARGPRGVRRPPRGPRRRRRRPRADDVRRPADRPAARPAADGCRRPADRRRHPAARRRPPPAYRPVDPAAGRPAARAPAARRAGAVAAAPAPPSRRPTAGAADGRGADGRAAPLHDAPPTSSTAATPTRSTARRPGAGAAAVRRWSGGLITPRMGPDELAYEQDRPTIQKDFDGPRTIAFINPKGGAAKTTGVLAAGYTFGTVRGGGVVAWDNNETRGTLGIRGTRSTHRNTTRELLEDLERFTDVYQSRIGDLGAFVRSQGDAHFDVLASDERPDVTGTIRASRLRRGAQAARALLPGDPDRHRQQHARRELAGRGRCRRPAGRHQHGPRGHRLQRPVDARRAAGRRLPEPQAQDRHGALRPVRATSTPSSPPTWSTSTSSAPAAVYRVPYDPALVAGSVVPYAQLSDEHPDAVAQGVRGDGRRALTR